MDVVLHLLLVLHLLGWAIVLGGTIVTIRQPALPRGAMHGALTALVTGVLMVAIAEAGWVDRDYDTAKMTVKLVVALVVTGLVVWLDRRPQAVTRGRLGAVLGLTVLDVAIAALWR